MGRSGVLVALFGLISLAAQAAETRMVLVPAVPFVMGSDDGPEDERPSHSVDLGPFEIDVTPVTNAQFAAFLEARGLRSPRGERLYDDDDRDARIHVRDRRFRAYPGYEHHPVLEASWPGAREYCGWRGKRLPTEAEWETAARGTDGRRDRWGNDAPDATRARFAAGWHGTLPVGSFPRGAGPYGVLDMAGNVWEWVASAYRLYPYRASDGREDPAVDVVRGTRGGGMDSSAAEITATQRGRALSRAPRAGHHNIGFRCAL